MCNLMTDTLLAEYEGLIAKTGEDATDEEIIAALTERQDWTDKGARAILTLARTYGTAILRNALALASAMNIEDGAGGL